MGSGWRLSLCTERGDAKDTVRSALIPGLRGAALLPQPPPTPTPKQPLHLVEAS